VGSSKKVLEDEDENDVPHAWSPTECVFKLPGLGPIWGSVRYKILQTHAAGRHFQDDFHPPTTQGRMLSALGYSL
jgi:hypothetical protein